MAGLSIKTMELTMLVSVIALVSGHTHLPPAPNLFRKW